MEVEVEPNDDLLEAKDEVRQQEWSDPQDCRQLLLLLLLQLLLRPIPPLLLLPLLLPLLLKVLRSKSLLLV